MIEAVFRRQLQPIVVIVEDLHWSGSENFAVFNWLTRIIQDMPLLIIGMATSIIGMGFRYLAHLRQKHEIRKAKDEAKRR